MIAAAKCCRTELLSYGGSSVKYLQLVTPEPGCCMHLARRVARPMIFDDNFSLYFDASLVINKFQAKPLPFSFA